MKLYPHTIESALARRVLLVLLLPLLAAHALVEFFDSAYVFVLQLVAGWVNELITEVRQLLQTVRNVFRRVKISIVTLWRGAPKFHPTAEDINAAAQDAVGKPDPSIDVVSDRGVGK